MYIQIFTYNHGVAILTISDYQQELADCAEWR